MAFDNKSATFADFQAREKALFTGRQYLNLFHQLHVIEAGLLTLNKEFIALPDDVVNILPELPGGVKFKQHILNLKNGITPIDKIDPDLLPFGKEVFLDDALYEKYTSFQPLKGNLKQEKKENNIENRAENKPSIQDNLDLDNSKAIFDYIRGFQNTPKHLEEFKKKEEVHDCGPEWKSKISNMIINSNEPDKDNLKRIFEELCVFDYALNIWQECVVIIKNPKLKSKEEISSKLTEYKKYLAMFGNGGNSLYDKVEALTK